MNDKQTQQKLAPIVGKPMHVTMEQLKFVQFLSKVENVNKEPIARLELNWPTFALLMETSIKTLYQKLDNIEARNTEEALLRQEIIDALKRELSSGFGALREVPYSKEQNPQRLDLILDGNQIEKRLLSIEVKSDRSKLDELAQDWVKLRGLEGGGRKISIFAGFATKKVYENNENFFMTVKDGRHPEYPYVKQIATQHWNTEHARTKKERKLFIYVWAIDTPKPNMKFDIYEIEDKDLSFVEV